MELDFSKLNSISAGKSSSDSHTEPLKKEAEAIPTAPAIGLEKANNATGEQSIGNLATAKLDMIQADHERSLEVYRDYQKNIKASYQIRTEILKNLRAGVAPGDLFLKACEAIGIMTDDKGFYSQVEQAIESTRQ